MIDIHSHIIFGVDDGPKTMEDSLALIALSYAQGVRTIVATSHRRKGMFETPENIIFEKFQTLKEAAESRFPNLQLLFGAEIYYTQSSLDKLSQHIFPTMNETRFVLIEFSGLTSWKEMHIALQNILLLGLTPIIAHIERYQALEGHKKRVEELMAMGCYTQVNATHVLKAKLFRDPFKVYKKRTQYFLEHNLVHLVASDMHSCDNRPPHMKEAYQLIKDKYGDKRAQSLFRDHAQTLLENQFL